MEMHITKVQIKSIHGVLTILYFLAEDNFSGMSSALKGFRFHEEE